MAMVGRDVPPPSEGIWQQESDAYTMLELQTAQEQVAYRAARPQCTECHMHFDPYGMALDRYDTLGRLRTVDQRGRPIDSHTTLPPALGGVPISGAIELAQVLVRSDVFVQWMATEMLRYGLIGYLRGTAKPVRRPAARRVRGQRHRAPVPEPLGADVQRAVAGCGGLALVRIPAAGRAPGPVVAKWILTLLLPSLSSADA